MSQIYGHACTVFYKYLEKLFVVHTSMCELEVAVTAQEVRKTVE